MDINGATVLAAIRPQSHPAGYSRYHGIVFCCSLFILCVRAYVLMCVCVCMCLCVCEVGEGGKQGMHHTYGWSGVQLPLPEKEWNVGSPK